MKPKIGWIGTGVMGGACASRLLAAGYKVAVFTRTRSKAEPLLDAGAVWADSPRAVAERSDVVFSIVGYPRDVREIFFGADGVLSAWSSAVDASDAGPCDGSSGAANADPSGKIFVDMTTSSPELAVEIADAAARAGFDALDAPVSGGDVGAKNGTLSIMVGGSDAAFERLASIFACLGTNVRRQGGPGAGQRTKTTNQILIAGNMIGVCEALLYAYRAGLDLDAVLASVSSGAAGSWSLSNLAPRVLRGDFAPGFFVEHFVKDLGIALDDAERLRLSLPGVALARQLYLALIAQGGGRLGTQALIKALATLSNVDAFGVGATR
ncbi:MAG: NAD(P)-dependent oxidoreductase [Thermoguttaceae bacterium]|nr:NAD(P)-dependent oxidoreductase [Thermoguttaceae bacterium]